MINTAKIKTLKTLKNHFLIAMPVLTDPYFKKSVVYICEHDDQGAMGFIINFPVKLTLQELLKNVDQINHIPTIDAALLSPVFLGGPLDLERGFILHSPTEKKVQSTQLNDELMVSNSKTLLCSLGTDDAPAHYFVALGYSSWDPGQLEEEMNNNHWLTIDCKNDIIFNIPPEKRWEESLQVLGICPDQLSTMAGNV